MYSRNLVAKEFLQSRPLTLAGALTLTWRTATIPEFEDYFLDLTPDSFGDGNPFLVEFWENKFKCNIGDNGKAYDRNCTGNPR